MSTNIEQVIAEALLGAGLTNKPDEFDSNIHSWRCEHPDRYGRCKCFEETVADIAAALRAANRLREPAVPDAATEAKQPEGWSTEDRQESKQEAERRWVDERSGYKSDYNRGCINGFILGAEWQKARETFISFRSIADEARAERDAALEAIERVRAIHEFDDGYCKSCEIPFHECDIATALVAALDGAPEPEEKP